MSIKATKLPPNNKSACLCRACGNVFKSVRPFAGHRRDGKCLEPESIGLSLNKSGLWRWPDTRFNKKEDV